MLSIRCRYLLLFFIGLSILALGCNQSKSGSSTGNSASPATPQTVTTQVAGSSSPLPPTVVPPEEFHAVDFEKTGLALEIRAVQMEWNAKGWITLCSGCVLTAVDAHGHSMPISLVSKSIRDGGFQTKDFDIIKMRSSGGFSGGDFLMQDSHLKDLQQRLKEYVSAKQGSKAPVHQ
jgi:hypothetical protein